MVLTQDDELLLGGAVVAPPSGRGPTLGSWLSREVAGLRVELTSVLHAEDRRASLARSKTAHRVGADENLALWGVGGQPT